MLTRLKEMSHKMRAMLNSLFTLPKSAYKEPTKESQSSKTSTQPAMPSTFFPVSPADLHSENTVSPPPEKYTLVNREQRKREQCRQVTVDSENVRRELLEYGVVVRDFQAESDAEGGLDQVCSGSQNVARGDRFHAILDGDYLPPERRRTLGKSWAMTDWDRVQPAPQHRVRKCDKFEATLNAEQGEAEITRLLSKKRGGRP